MVSYLEFHLLESRLSHRLNPYCSGRWSRTLAKSEEIQVTQEALILVVVDNGLVQSIMKKADFKFES